jgi:hypothetical protein
VRPVAVWPVGRDAVEQLLHGGGGGSKAARCGEARKSGRWARRPGEDEAREREREARAAGGEMEEGCLFSRRCLLYVLPRLRSGLINTARRRSSCNCGARSTAAVPALMPLSSAMLDPTQGRSTLTLRTVAHRRFLALLLEHSLRQPAEAASGGALRRRCLARRSSLARRVRCCPLLIISTCFRSTFEAA